MLLNEWAKRWNIPQAALTDLLTTLGAGTEPQSQGNRSEAVNQQKIRLLASAAGTRLWRNNNGACVDDRGNFIRYGLANESKKINSVIKSSDLIGITPVTVSGSDVGKKVGVFTAIEVKKEGWKFTGQDRETAQLRFLALVISMGGFAKFNSNGRL